jgi:hypothetical protein
VEGYSLLVPMRLLSVSMEALLGVYGGFANHEWQYVIGQIALIDCHGS